MDEKFVQGVVGGVLKRHENLTLDSKRIQTLMVEIAANIDLVSSVKQKDIDAQNRNYNFIMSEMSQGEREHLYHWQKELPKLESLRLIYLCQFMRMLLQRNL